VPTFYALNDAKTPLFAALISVVFNIGLNLALMRPLGYRGLALATARGGFRKFWLFAVSPAPTRGKFGREAHPGLLGAGLPGLSRHGVAHLGLSPRLAAHRRAACAAPGYGFLKYLP